MAKIDYLHGGRLSGLIGNAVFAGDNVRVRPRKRRADEWTPAQKSQRSRYRAVVDLYKKLRNVLIMPVWKCAAQNGLTAYNLFISENMAAFDTEGKIKDPTLLKMAIGELPRPFNMTASINISDPTKVDITWENDEVIDLDRETDHLVAVFYNGQRFSRPVSTEFLRKDEAASLEFPEKYGPGSYVYVFFGNSRKDAYCESWVGRL